MANKPPEFDMWGPEQKPKAMPAMTVIHMHFCYSMQKKVSETNVLAFFWEEFLLVHSRATLKWSLSKSRVYYTCVTMEVALFIDKYYK